MLARSKEGCAWDFQRNKVITGLPSAAVKPDTKEVASFHDVIVIGAGFAGLTAARDLSLQGLRTLLLEARDRIGGRTWSAKGQNDDYEMGGGWVHHLQPHVWAEMSRYGLVEPKRSIGLSPDTPLNIDGKLQNVEEADASFLPLAAAFFDVDGQGGRSVMPQANQPLLNREAIARWDISAEERIRQMDVSPEQKKLLHMWMAISGLTDVSKIGFLSLLRLYALSGYSFQQFLEINGTFKIPGGTTALANRIFAEFKGPALFNRHITSITSTSGGATVQVKDGEKFSANQVICTIPIHCLADINFSPPLPESFTSIVHHNLGGKLHAHSPNGSARFFGVTTPDKAACFGFTESESKTGGVNMVLFRSSRLETANPPPLAILDEVLQDLKPDAVDLGTINEYLWHDWQADQFAKGAWPVYPSKTLSGSLSRLMENKRVTSTLTLAGSDWADGWVGYMDGAIEQGRRAAFAIGHELVYMRSGHDTLRGKL
ncbi:hypothetical protein N0V84_007541 [Fusarium piperis]|uniref:Amine oxidase n=1 Tax=Fusarium piperis TaxID=1435070 RepID=A0A9W8W9V2_9HYPO|nr:hypothetical protein N0V84_007541 [Fusarium piperis]